MRGGYVGLAQQTWPQEYGFNRKPSTPKPRRIEINGGLTAWLIECAEQGRHAKPLENASGQVTKRCGIETSQDFVKSNGETSRMIGWTFPVDGSRVIDCESSKHGKPIARDHAIDPHLWVARNHDRLPSRPGGQLKVSWFRGGTTRGKMRQHVVKQMHSLKIFPFATHSEFDRALRHRTPANRVRIRALENTGCNVVSIWYDGKNVSRGIQWSNSQAMRQKKFS